MSGDGAWVDEGSEGAAPRAKDRPEDDPDASQPLTPSGLPLLLKVLLCFLLCDAGARTIELIRWRLAQQEDGLISLTVSPFAPHLPQSVLWIVVNLLLALFLWYRTSLGRLLTEARFVVHIALLGYLLAVRNPELWVYLEAPHRARLLGTLAFDLLVVVYLQSRQAREVLVR